MSKEGKLTLSIGFKKYLVWIVVNFIFCPLPILGIYLYNYYSKGQIFSSFIVYNYTLLIVSLYLFLTQLKNNLKKESTSDLLIWLTFLAIIIFWGLFWSYHYPHRINDFITGKLIFFSGAMLIITFILALFLNIPVLKLTIKDAVNRVLLYEAQNEMEKKSNDWYKRLEKEEK
jgi:O-antigen ligase